MLYLLALIPITAYLVILKGFDAFSIIRFRWFSASILIGCTCTLLALSLSRLYMTISGSAWEGVWISPLIEETLKASLLFYLVFRQRIVFIHEAMIYGGAIGAGFALAENISYVSVIPMNTYEALMRGLETSLLHMGMTAIATSLMLIMLHRPPRKFFIKAVLSLLLPITMHILHNMMLIDITYQLLIVMTGIMLAFYGISHIGNTQLTQWLDISFEQQVTLITAFKKGELQNTNSGAYLQQLKNKFSPEVFFDMVVYVQLYLEMALWAKGRLMLHEVGLDKPLTDDELRQNREKHAELLALRKRIPVIGLQLLKPILMSGNKDEWVLRMHT